MKKFIIKYNSSHLILILLFGLCLIWLVKLEIEAASLKSILKQHHTSLESGDDALEIDWLFIRDIKKRSFISLMDDNAVMQIHNSSIGVLKHEIRMKSDGKISIGPSENKSLGYDKEQDHIYLKNGESYVLVGELHSIQTGKSLGNAVMLASKIDGPYIAVQNEFISLEVPTKKDRYMIAIDPTQEIVGMKLGKSSVTIKKNNINIEAVGDINITSKNGKVNINGKR